MIGIQFFFLSCLLMAGTCLELKNGAYEDLVIRISENVPEHDCKNIIDNLQTTLTSASQYLFSALDSRAYLRSATVLLPPSWADSCVPSAVVSGSGEASDITILPSDPARGKLWTQQSLGCGQPGDQIYMGFEGLLKRDHSLGRTLIKEFAMYRYGVFEEQGYHNDPINPLCYHDDQSKKAKITGCSDLPIDNSICLDPSKPYNVTKMIDENARSSIMFAAEAPSVSMFCDDGNHDRFAPTKHNLVCQRRSVLDVILKHSDFAVSNNSNNLNSNQIRDTTPKIVFKKQTLTRFVFVIENTKDMMLRESWIYLRLALRQWALYTLPENTEVGVVLTAHPQPTRALNIDSVKNNANVKDKFYSSIPYTPDETMQPGCLHCAINEAMTMLNARSRSHGPAANVIVTIAPGMNVDENLRNVLKLVKKSKIRIATINYPTIVRSNTLRLLAEETGGVDYTIFENKSNVATTLLSTYFELHNALYNIIQTFYSGSLTDLPVEIHRREIRDDRSSTTGSFMLDANMGEPAKFKLFTHNTIAPLIKSIKLISPSQQVFTERNDRLIDFKIITLNTNISETGTWTYTIETYQGSPQPHFIQVMATPKSALKPYIRTRFWTHRDHPGAPLVLFAEVKNGDLPVLGAKVEVLITKHEYNNSLPQKTLVELWDTGAGDPDITKGDGVYSRYFSAAEYGSGLYSFQATISDNGNTAYTWTDTKPDDNKPCCGSVVSSSGVRTISPFQRIQPKITMLISADEILSASQSSAGRIGDLRAEIIANETKARLTWTSPDMAGHTVSRYEVKYANTVLDIVDNFETSATIWDNNEPFILSPGSETTLSIDLAQNKELLDKPLYFAVKAYPRMSSDAAGPVSNWVRVVVPSPPPPPTVPPAFSSNNFWPQNTGSMNTENAGPSVAEPMSIGLELILPVVMGIIIFIVLLIACCYFRIAKKRHNSNKKSGKAIKNDKLNSNITIVPSTPQNMPQVPNYTSADIPDPHQIGVPVNNYAYEDETKKRFSLVHQQEQQLIEELKQQQQMVHQQRDNMTPNTYGGLSVISNSNINRTGHTLSPYNSWSASQLLHEHERRHSPMENMMQDEQMMQHQELLLNGSQMDHMSLNNQSMDHVSINGHHIGEHYPPPVPPLPSYANGYPINSIYGIHQQNPPIYQSMQRNEAMGPFNPSLQGSMSSVNSGEKKRRNVTMV